VPGFDWLPELLAHPANIIAKDRARAMPIRAAWFFMNLPSSRAEYLLVWGKKNLRRIREIAYCVVQEFHSGLQMNDVRE